MEKTNAAWEYSKERLERLMSAFTKYNSIKTAEDYDKLDTAIADMAEGFNLAECNRCGKFFDINELHVYSEDDTRYSEYVCNTCWK